MRAFDFINAHSAQEAVELLRTYGKRAQLFASGADVLFMLKDAIEGPKETPPEVLINLGKITELEGIRYDSTTGLWLGAMTRLIDLVEHQCGRHGEGAVREVDDAGAAVDQDEALCEQRVDGSGAEAEHREDQEAAHLPITLRSSRRGRGSPTAAALGVWST